MADQISRLTSTFNLTPPEIPIRSSSKQAVEMQKSNSRKSQEILKRKISEESVPSLRRTKLRIEYQEGQRELLELEKKELRLSYDDQELDQKTFRMGMRNTNRSIIELGKHIWDLKREERTMEEAAGFAPVLTVDTTTAYISLLLKLYKDEKKGNRKPIDQKSMKRDCLAKYESNKGGQDSSARWCPIAHKWFEKEEMVAAHIVPNRIDRPLVDYAIGEGMGDRQFTADNGLLINYQAERSFDNHSFVIVPVDLEENPIMRFKIMMVPGHEDAKVGCGLGLSLKDIDGRELKFLNDFRPAKRFLYFHFVMTRLLESRKDENTSRQFITATRTSKPWPTMGKYLRKSMLPAISESMGDTWRKDWAEDLDEGNLFDDKKDLPGDVNREIGRQIVIGCTMGKVVHDMKDDEDDEEDDDEEEDDEEED